MIGAKRSTSVWTIILTLGFCLPIYAQEGNGKINGVVVNSGDYPIIGGTVVVRSEDGEISRTLSTGKLGDYSVEDLPDGTYMVDAWSTVDERSSQSGIALTQGSERQVNLKLDSCLARQIDWQNGDYAIRTQIKAETDFEKGLADEAQRIPCSADATSKSPPEEYPIRCANLDTMEFFSGLVKKSEVAGPNPEVGEGTVLTGSYFRVTVGFDSVSKLWIVKLRLEYKLVCGMLCGQEEVFERWVYFDPNGAFSKVDEDCGCRSEVLF